MQIEIAKASPEIGGFVTSVEGGKLCHVPEWGLMIMHAFGHEPIYLVARENGAICGVLPLTIIRSRLFGDRMVSEAFSNYGGPLTTRPEVSAELLDHAYVLAREYWCPVVELRTVELMPGNLFFLNDKVCMVLPLSRDPEQTWRNLRSEIRNRVRSARKSGLIVVHGGEELLDDFYGVWTARMRQLGTPCYPRHFFESLLGSMPMYTKIFVVRQDKGTIAAGLFNHFNGFAECRWAAASTGSGKLSPNTLLYWSAIEHYCLAGCSSFDFGRSTVGSSQHEFKRRWGARQVQLWYQYRTQLGHELSVARPDNRRMVEIWKRLPLRATRVLGPWISRSLP
jgi:FemAB-related protein (PEP-CTERM system-associated)